MNFNRFKKIDNISIKNRYEEAKSLKIYICIVNQQHLG